MRLEWKFLKHNYCVRALTKAVKLSESTVSQHLKILHEAGLLIGDKRGYFIHYSVDQSVLDELAKEIETLANIEQEVFTQESSNYSINSVTKCVKKNCCYKGGKTTSWKLQTLEILEEVCF